MNITVKINDRMTIECTVYAEGNQWAVGAGEFARMPYGFGATIVEAVADYIRKINNELPPKPVAAPQPLDWVQTASPDNFPYPPEPIVPPRQTIR